MRNPAIRLWPVAVLLMLSAPAVAGVRRALLVVTPLDDQSTRRALTLQREVGAIVGRDARLDLVDPSSIYAAAGLARTSQQTQAAQRSVEEVDDLAKRLELKAARARAELALEALRGVDYRAVRSMHLELLVLLARVKFTLKADDRGASELAQALVIDPDLAPPRGLNSVEKAWFASARGRAAADAAVARVTIEAPGSEGLVWVDGQLRGPAPATITGLRPGRHFITLAPLGEEPQHRSELLGAVERVSFSVEPTPEGRNFRALLGALASGLRRGEAAAPASDLMAWARVDEVLVVGLTTTGGPKVHRWTASGTVEPADVAEGTPPAIAEALLRLFEARVSNPAVRAAVAAVESPAPLPDPPRSRAPGVVLLSIAGAAVVAGTILAIAGRGAFDGAQPGAVNQVAYRDGIQRANSLASASIGAFSGAAIAGGIGVALVW